MIPAERHQKIIELVSERQFMSLNDLSGLLKVSVMTVRRDISELSSSGVVIAVRGGVRSLPVAFPSSAGQPETRSLIRTALSYVGDSQSLFLDSGELSYELARLILWRPSMQVLTNNFRIAEHIANYTSAQLVLTGGEFSRADKTFQPRYANKLLKDLRFDLLFLAPACWNENGGWHHDESRQSWYSALMDAAHQSVILADSRFYSGDGKFRMYDFNNADVIVSNHACAERLFNKRINPLKLHPLRHAPAKFEEKV